MDSYGVSNHERSLDQVLAKELPEPVPAACRPLPLAVPLFAGPVTWKLPPVCQDDQCSCENCYPSICSLLRAI